ncbi:MAG: PAS domain-containing sensor histidine kinase [Pseudomonadota bacterium]
MAGRVRASSWVGFRRVVRGRRFQNAATIIVVAMGPILATATVAALRPIDEGASGDGLRAILLIDLIYVLVVAALILQRLARMIAARRAHSDGSRLHLRLSGTFAVFTLIPTIAIAIFAVVTIGLGLESWFSERVRQVVGASLDAAQSYEAEHRADLEEDARALATILNRARRAQAFLGDGELRQLLAQGQLAIQRGLREAYVIDGTREIRARGERSYLFDFEDPGAAAMAEAQETGLVLIEDWDNNEFRALLPLRTFPDRYLYISRAVDGNILNLLDDAEATARLYQDLESERGRVLFEFALLYLGFALLLIMAAVWLGFWFAERLSGPIGRLAGAAQRVGTGDLDVQVLEGDGDDEISTLGTHFNQMVRQLRGQRQTLLANTAQIERRRRLFDSVLSSVTGGVVGLDAEGTVTFVNTAAERLLDVSDEALGHAAIAVVVPEFGVLFDRLAASDTEVAQEEIPIVRQGKQERLLVRLAVRRNSSGEREGYVLTFDDVTDLVSAQRMAAWGDVARRIAHEIKNPLTPIQLSAERINRKFSGTADDQAVQRLTEVIVRQTGDLRRIVDEFSKFARMPTPERQETDLVALIRDAVTLQDVAQEDVTIEADLPDLPLLLDIDPTMIGQAVTNLIKNAGEAIESYLEKGPPDDYSGRIRVTLRLENGAALIEISDNGIGLPQDRARLFEPYVTTRSSGTGLGLPIVRKIVEEHGGALILTDAEPFEPEGRCGAKAEVRLPVRAETETEVTNGRLAV